MELLKTEKGNASVALSRLRELQNTSSSSHKTVRVCCVELLQDCVLCVCAREREQVANYLECPSEEQR